MNNQIRQKIFERFKAHHPEPKTELIYSSNFELLIAVILSAQATDLSVNKVTCKLFPVANTPERLFALGEEGLKSFIKSINYYNTKAKNIIRTCKILIDEHHSEVPNTREALQQLPGVGRKTANVVLNTAFDHATVAVDTHIFRVSNRTGIATGKNVAIVDEKLHKTLSKESLKHANHWLVLHGRYVCTARKPKCPECFIRDLCEYPHKTLE